MIQWKQFALMTKAGHDRQSPKDRPCVRLSTATARRTSHRHIGSTAFLFDDPPPTPDRQGGCQVVIVMFYEPMTPLTPFSTIPRSAFHCRLPCSQESRFRKPHRSHRPHPQLDFLPRVERQQFTHMLLLLQRCQDQMGTNTYYGCLCQ
jgi:hypothetical protein